MPRWIRRYRKVQEPPMAKSRSPQEALDPTLLPRKAEAARIYRQIWPYQATSQQFYYGSTNPALREYVRAMVWEVAAGGDDQYLMDQAYTDPRLHPSERDWLVRARAEIHLRELERAVNL